MERAKLALASFALDLKNAKARQRTRARKGSTQALAICTALVEADWHFRRLRKEIKRIERLENRERSSKKVVVANKLAGVNRRMTGTYGK